jgi:hypothetical protein
MSNTLAVATVTAALQQLLADSITVQGATVTIGEPKAPATQPNPQVNICMYQISPNPGYRNYDLPAKDSKGKWLNQPVLGVDLYYLFTFYGNQLHLEPQRLLGEVITTLYTQPMLTENLINRAIQSPLYNSILKDSDLGTHNIELVKFVPQADPREEVAQLWRDYFQTIPYSLSLAYKASVVLITPNETLQPSTPVREVVIDVDSASLPCHKAKALDLTKTRIAFQADGSPPRTLAGTISVTKADDETGIKQYLLYWSIDGISKLPDSAPVAVLPATGETTLSYPVPGQQTVPAGANSLLVVTGNNLGEMASGLSSKLPSPSTDNSKLPVHQARGIDLSQLHSINNDAAITGTITIKKAADESDIETYHLYWSTDGIEKTVPIRFLAKTGRDLTYLLPAPLAIPPNAFNILVVTSNLTGEMVQGISAPIPLLLAAQGVTLNLAKKPNDHVGGEITIQKARDEGLIGYYHAYWGSSPQTKLPTNALIASVAPSGDDLFIPLSPPIPRPAAAKYVLVRTQGNGAEMTTGVFAGVPPLDKADAVIVNHFSLDANNRISGQITVKKAIDDRDIDQYCLYWSADGQTKLPNVAIITRLDNRNLTYDFPSINPIVLPEDASYLLVLSANNAGGEMASGVSAELPLVGLPNGIGLNLAAAPGGTVTGTITLHKATDETKVVNYLTYWSATAEGDNRVFIASRPKTGSDITLSLSPPVALPADAAYVYATTSGNMGEMTRGISKRLPPIFPAQSVSFNLRNDGTGNLSGSITVTPATHENTITEYRLYWSADGITSLSNLNAPLARLPKSGDLTYQLPPTRPLPSANFILVLTANDQGDLMPTGVSASFAPRNIGQGTVLNLSKAPGNHATGTIAIRHAADESDLERYNLYWGSDNQTQLNTTPIATLAKTGDNLVYTLSPPVARPPGSVTVLTYTANKLAEMNHGTSVGIPPLNMALDLTLRVTRGTNRQLTGTMTITKAPDESDLTQYRLYWATNATARLVGYPAFANLAKTGSNLVHTIAPADNLIVPTNATYIIVLTANAWAEMDKGASRVLPR